MCKDITLTTVKEKAFIKDRATNKNKEVMATFLKIDGTGYKYYSMFPWITEGKEQLETCPIKLDLLYNVVFRQDPNPSIETSAGIIVPGVGKFKFHLHYNVPLLTSTYNNNFKPIYGDRIIESMKVSKHLALTLALKLAGEQGWQAMPTDGGNMPCANSMKLNYELRNQSTHLGKTCNDNGEIADVFPQHGLPHATNYGVTVMPIYGNGIPKSIAQFNLYDYLINWRRLYALPRRNVGLGGNINPPDSDNLVQELTQKVQMGDTDRYTHSFISVYITAHRTYGGFGTPNQCYGALIKKDVHPILCMHATYMVATEQYQLCQYPVWLVLPFRPLFLIMLQLLHMKKGIQFGKLQGAKWSVLLEVEENRKIFTNVFERQYHIKFPKGNLKDSHDCIMKQKTAGCPSVFNQVKFDKYMQDIFNFALAYTNSAYAIEKRNIGKEPNNIIATTLNYTLNTIILKQEAILAKQERQKHYGYVDPQKHARNVNKWKEVLEHAIDTDGYIDDVIRSELYFLIDRPPDPSVDVYPECR